SNNFGGDAFDNFEKAANGNDHRRRQPIAPGATYSAEADNQFPNRENQKKPEAKMCDAIEMVARETEEVFCPQAKRHSRVGIMRADDVNDNEQGKDRKSTRLNSSHVAI